VYSIGLLFFRKYQEVFMIILDNVSKHYQTRDKTRFAAVEPTSLEIQDGEIFGLMGYSGAGKSTLLRLINLLGSMCADKS